MGSNSEEKRMRRIFDELSDEITFEYDLGSDTMVFSEKYKEVYGRKNKVSHFVKGSKSVYSFSAKSVLYLESLKRVQDYKDEARYIQIQWPNKDGNFEWCELVFRQFVDEKGKVKAVGIWRNIDRKKRELVMLKHQVAENHMEGLANKVGIEKLVSQELEKLQDGERAALYMIDFDDMKQVQAEFGVLALEELLHLFSEELLVHFHEDGLVGHLGSDKFLVYLNQIKDKHSAETLAVRIRKLLQRLVQQLNIAKKVTVTIGITMVDNKKSYKEVVDEADIALRHGKNAGKDQLVMFSYKLQEEKYVKPVSGAVANTNEKRYDAGKIWPDLLERLYSSNDSMQSLFEAISFIGCVFKLDKVMVWEYDQERKDVSNVLQWAREGIPNTQKLQQNIPFSMADFEGVHNSDGIFYCTNRERMPERIREYAEMEHFHSLLQAKISFEEDELLGVIDFCVCSKGHVWVQEEVDLLLMMSRVLGEIIRKRNMTHKMELYYGNTRTILDSVITGIYVVDRETRELYYYNDAAAVILPEYIEREESMDVSQKKYFLKESAFWDLKRAEEDIIHFKMKNGKHFEIKATRMQWESRRNAYIVAINEHLPSKEEIERQKKQEYLEKRYAFIYSHSCDCIFDIDLEQDTYEATFINGDKLWVDLEEKGIFSKSFEAAVKKYVIAEDVEHLRSRFSYNGLKQAISLGETMIIDSYTVCNELGQLRTKEVRAFILEEDGQKRVVATYCDITEQRRKEMQILLERQKLNRALVNVYPLLLSINVSKDELNIVSNDTGNELIQYSSGTMSAAVLDSAMHLHPEDRDKFVAAFNRDNLLRTFTGEQHHLSMEFRQGRIDGTYHWFSVMCIQIDNPLNEDLLLYLFGRNIDKEKEMEQSLRDALNAAEQASEAKSDFLSRMSHEIRTPMNAIIGMTELSKHVIDQPEQLEGYLGKIDSSAQYLLGLINNILDMSRIESNKVVIEKKEFRMPDLLDNIQNIIGGQAKKKNIQFIIERKMDFICSYIGDRLRLSQVLINLLSNSVKFTDEYGMITLSVKENRREGNESYMCFTIADNGMGMSEDFMKKMYKPFEQENANSPQGMAGTGLGLSITKNLIALMDGHIKCKSRLGEGTTFIVEMKMDVVDNGKTIWKKAEDEQSEVEKNKKNLLVGKKILLAEDNELNQEIAVAMLEMKHIEVDCVENGELAVQKFLEMGSFYYDMILMDIRMPVKNGLDATSDIRAIRGAYAEEIPIVAMSANAFAEDKAKAFANGITDYMVKPIDVELLDQMLIKYLS